MTYRHFKYEGWLYGLAFLLALGLRLIQLGAIPLNDAEAAPALQALQIAQGSRPALAPHPLYIVSTSILFFLYGGGTNFLARLIPALIGSLLVFVPRLFEDRLKPRPGLLLAFFIALDPGLTALSRQAASPILAIAFLFAAWACISKNKMQHAGFFAAIALLSGPSIWPGLLGLGITWAILQGLNSRRPAQTKVEHSNFDVKAALPAFTITFVTAGTLFFIVPNGLSAVLASISAFINAWLIPSDVSAGRLFLSLLVYQPLALLLALIAILRGLVRGSPRIIPLSIWLLVSLLLAVFLPSRHVSDLAWTLIPLCALAALEFARSFTIFPEERSEVIGLALLTAFIWTFAWLDFAGMVWLPSDSQQYLVRLWLLIGALVMLLLSILLVAAGWSVRTARIGGVWGMALVLGLLGFGGTLGAAGLRGSANPELWRSPSIPAQAELLQKTVWDISGYGLGHKTAASVVIVGLDSPALEWALRGHDVSVVGSLNISSSPHLVITPFQMDSVLEAAYRGQDFGWRENPLWSPALPNDWRRWVVLRQMPQAGETIILWVRDDLFLDR